MKHKELGKKTFGERNQEEAPRGHGSNEVGGSPQKAAPPRCTAHPTTHFLL